MSTITIEDGAEVSGEDMGQGISAASTSHALFIIPTREAASRPASMATYSSWPTRQTTGSLRVQMISSSPRLPPT